MITKEAKLRERVFDLLAFERAFEARARASMGIARNYPQSLAMLPCLIDTAKQHTVSLVEYLGQNDVLADHPFVTLLSGQSITLLLAAVHATIGYGIAGYTILTAMAFRLYNPQLREIAPKHLKAYATLAQAG